MNNNQVWTPRHSSLCAWWLKGKSVVLWQLTPDYFSANYPKMIVYKPLRKGGASWLRPFIAYGDCSNYTIEREGRTRGKDGLVTIQCRDVARPSDLFCIVGRHYWNGETDTTWLSLFLWLSGFFSKEQMMWGSNAHKQYPGYCHLRDVIHGEKKLTTRKVRRAIYEAQAMPRPEWVKMGSTWIPGE